jgi:hypothetical protein
MLIVYAATFRRHRQHIEDHCDRRALHQQAIYLIERATWSANSAGESLRGGLPWALDRSRFTRGDQ